VATVGSAVAGVCEKLQKQLWKLARQCGSAGERLGKAHFDAVEFSGGAMRLRTDPACVLSFHDVLQANRIDDIEATYTMLPNVLKQKKYVRATHSAVFCEVRVDEALGTVRVTRVVSAVAAGRILSPTQARSQIIGGVVWGISQALHEETLADHALGRFMNHSFAEYHIAANADVPEIDVIFADEDDRIVSRIGAKGVGEIGIVGVAAAISNAIYHATGRRLRSTPMTPDKIMAT
jgi:xanthine dehydrogenase YagR molybdenum-binding subunit